MKTNWLDSVYTDGSRFFVTPSLPKKGEAVTIKLRMFADAPVVDEGALAHGVNAGKFGGRDGAGDLAPLLSLLGDLAQQFIIGASLV